MNSIFPVIKLNANADRRLLLGHRWIYSNEINTVESPIKSFEPGEVVNVCNAKGRTLGSACINAHALLCGRLFSDVADTALESVIQPRLQAALHWREQSFDAPFYRLIYGDGDGLSGLIVDRFGDTLVLQVTTAGMYRVLNVIVDELSKLIQPSGILLRNDSDNESEALSAETRVLYGDVPDSVSLIENGLSFQVPLFNGQKTGWFYDHRTSRLQMQQWVKGCEVLDVYSYLGGWGLQALQGGADSVHCIDRSSQALDYVQKNAGLLGFDDRCLVTKSMASDALKKFAANGRLFDVVILDPPAFIKRRKDQRNGEKAYHQMNQLAMKVLRSGGLLISASCSLHLSRESLMKIVHLAAHKSGRQARIVFQGGLGADHPTLTAIPEMDYLKTVFARIV